MIELRSPNKKLKLWRVQFLEIKGKILNKQSIVYHHQIEIQPRVSEIERKTLLAGRFILGTNQEFIAQKYCGTIKINRLVKGGNGSSKTHNFFPYVFLSAVALMTMLIA